MLDLIFYALLITLAGLLGWAGRDICRSIRRRLSSRRLFRYELLVAREGTIRREGGSTYVRLASDDDRGGRARVVAGTALLRGQRSCARPQVSRSTINSKGGRTERHFRRT